MREADKRHDEEKQKNIKKNKNKTIQEQILKIPNYINTHVNINLYCIHTHINLHHLEKTEFCTFICKFRCLDGAPSFQMHVQCHVSFFILHLQCDKCMCVCVCFVF